MKKQSVIIFIFLFTSLLKAMNQDLTGKWKGIFMYGEVGLPFHHPFLEFYMNEDSSYTVKSFFREKYIDNLDTPTIYNVHYRGKNSKSIILKETSLLSPDTLKRVCFMKYRLRLKKRKGIVFLEGDYIFFFHNVSEMGRCVV